MYFLPTSTSCSSQYHETEFPYGNSNFMFYKLFKPAYFTVHSVQNTASLSAEGKRVQSLQPPLPRRWFSTLRLCCYTVVHSSMPSHFTNPEISLLVPTHTGTNIHLYVELWQTDIGCEGSYSAEENCRTLSTSTSPRCYFISPTFPCSSAA